MSIKQYFNKFKKFISLVFNEKSTKIVAVNSLVEYGDNLWDVAYLQKNFNFAGILVKVYKSYIYSKMKIKIPSNS